MSRRSEFQSALLDWYDANHRDLPWRRTRDPYAIWVSEAMAQQTTVGVVVPYWQRWMERFPDVPSLSRAEEKDVLEMWQGLGYYRRAKALLAGARAMQATGVPTDRTGWLAIPGVGPYTASAISSIAFGETTAVVDGNVERVYSRLNRDKASGATLKRNATAWADTVVDQERPGDWNQSVMELGATVCTPRNPSCRACPVRRWCESGKVGDAELLPTKSPKPEAIELDWTCRLLHCDGHWAMEQVEAGRWWEGMWRFPTEERLPREPEVCLITIKHTVTRHKIRMAVLRHEVTERSGQYSWVETDEVLRRPLPALYLKAWQAVHSSPAIPGLQEV